jgi:hypothetical protein
MFDPLAGASLTLDKIKEMCDELIAAHGFEKDGGYLPALDSPKSLVPTSGKTFGRVDGKILHASWDKAQAKAAEDFVRVWRVIGPFPSPTPGEVHLDMPTVIDEHFTARGDGSVDLNTTFTVDGKKFAWTKAIANTKTGGVDLDEAVGRVEWAIAYGYVEIESIHARECVIRIGSDDGIAIWLNGKLVHKHETGRGYTPGADTATVQLKEGINRIFVKIDNYKNGWAFGVGVPKANF